MNNNINIYIAIALSISLLLYGCHKEITKKNLDAEIEQVYNNSNLPSLSACIFKENGIKWEKYLGYADLAKGIEASEETVYHIGSITKLFIVTAIMQLEEQGKLDLDEDINTYVPINFRHPDFPEIPITTRMLLTHTAGIVKPRTYNSLNGMWNLFDPDMGPPPSEWVPQYLIPDGINYDANLWLLNRPGEYEIYSNIGACVAAYIVEELTQKNFREYCKENIFIPLEMNSTSYNYADLEWDKIAIMYDKSGYGSEYLDNRVYASGGAKSTLEDLSHFAICYMNKGVYNGTRILKDESVNKILDIQNQASGKCLIWNIYFGDWYGHTGALELGTSTTLTIHVESKTGLIIFTNALEGTVNPGGEIYWLIRQKANEYFD